MVRRRSSRFGILDAHRFGFLCYGPRFSPSTPASSVHRAPIALDAPPALRGPPVRTWAWWSRRSSIAVTAAAPPSLPQSSTERYPGGALSPRTRLRGAARARSGPPKRGPTGCTPCVVTREEALRAGASRPGRAGPPGEGPPAPTPSPAPAGPAPLGACRRHPAPTRILAMRSRLDQEAEVLGDAHLRSSPRSRPSALLPPVRRLAGATWRE